eukprot:4484890-Prymnesium_polylepis.1
MCIRDSGGGGGRGVRGVRGGVRGGGIELLVGRGRRNGELLLDAGHVWDDIDAAGARAPPPPLRGWRTQCTARRHALRGSPCAGAVPLAAISCRVPQ